ncbi:MAG: RIO1 family regulatory kinase/ATPase [Methanomicrobiales archaeon]|nr:RIO1 family regulatory kinase/ATPase [Methanomicrobiales archaeon]
MPLSAEHIRSLKKLDVKILLAIERLMRTSEWVPLELLKAHIDLSEGELTYRLGRLIEMDMVRFTPLPYEGYALVFTGYDALALTTLAARGTLKALGPQIGVGKESIVYEGLGLGPLVLKLHRVGQRSFRSVRVNRGYLPERGHMPRIFASIYSAAREYEALKRLHPEVSVPLPIDRNRHVVVISLFDGAPLHRCALDEPEEVLDSILRNVRIAFRKGIIHGDLSEFNVMWDGERVCLIDWPQWVGTEHPDGMLLLRRDLENILAFFHRKYRIGISVEEMLAEVAE